MTNEELVMKIKAGETKYMGELYCNLYRYINWFIRPYYRKYKQQFHGLCVYWDDLEQEAYFAVLSAVESYDESMGYKFTTILKYHLKKVILKAGKQDSDSNKNNAKLIVAADRLDRTQFKNDETSETLEAQIVDEQAERDFKLAIGDEEYLNIREDLEEAIADLPIREAKLITDKYFKNCSLPTLAKTLRLSKQQVNNIEKKALDTLRRDKRLEKYKRFRRKKQELMDKHKIGYKFTKFRERQMSSQESYIIQLEELEKAYGIK